MISKSITNDISINNNWFNDLIQQFNCDEKINIKSCVVLKNNELVGTYAKEPYSLEDMSLLFSMTKSITSLAIGIACDKGYLSLDDRIVDIFPDKLPEKVSENLSSIKISDLLLMASGIHDNTYGELFPHQDWVKAFLDQNFEHEPGTYYRYSTHGSHMLSAIVQEKTGSNLLDFLDVNLFEPLGISRPQWEVAPDGYIAGGMGLSLRAIDIAKIGQLLLDDGIYNHQRIISKRYLDLATNGQITKYSEMEEKPYIDISGKLYGYQFHIDKHGNCRMDGAFGQLCLVLKDYNMVIVVTSVKSNVENLLCSIYKSLGKIATFTPKQKRYVFKPDINETNETVIEFNEESIRIKETNSQDFEASEIFVNRDNLFHGQTLFVKDIQNHVQKYISKVIEETSDLIQMRIWYVETPYIVDYILYQKEDAVVLEYKINVSFTKKSFKVEASN